MDNDAELLAYSDEKEPVLYEVGYHLLSVIPEEDVPGEGVKIRDAIDSRGGMFVSEGAPKLVRLAYQMSKVIGNKRKRFDSAFFGWIRFRMAPHDVGMFREDVKRNEHVLRSIVIRAEEEKPAPLKKMTFLSGRRTAAAAGSAPEEKVRERLSEEELEKTIEGLVA